MATNYLEEAWNILVVDDIQVHRYLMANGLTRHNPFIKVTETSSVVEAIAALSIPGARYDAVVSDWNMPNHDGSELVKWMRARPVFERVPFVMISVNTESEDIIQAFMDLGVDAYVVKPFRLDDLQRKIRAAIEARQ